MSLTQGPLHQQIHHVTWWNFTWPSQFSRSSRCSNWKMNRPLTFNAVVYYQGNKLDLIFPTLFPVHLLSWVNVNFHPSKLLPQSNRGVNLWGSGWAVAKQILRLIHSTLEKGWRVSVAPDSITLFSLKYRFMCTFRGKLKNKKQTNIYVNFHQDKRFNRFSGLTAVYHLQLRRIN